MRFNLAPQRFPLPSLAIIPYPVIPHYVPPNKLNKDGSSKKSSPKMPPLLLDYVSQPANPSLFDGSDALRQRRAKNLATWCVLIEDVVEMAWLVFKLHLYNTYLPRQ